MKTKLHTFLAGLALAGAALLPASGHAQSAANPPAGRLLASNCFQCHGTDGRPAAGFERLAGKSATSIYEELNEMRTKPEKNDIMRIHALGYTDQQLWLIANYFAKQPK